MRRIRQAIGPPRPVRPLDHGVSRNTVSRSVEDVHGVVEGEWPDEVLATRPEVVRPEVYGWGTFAVAPHAEGADLLQHPTPICLWFAGGECVPHLRSRLRAHE